MYRSKHEIEEINRFFSSFDWGWISRDERHWWPQFCFHYSNLPNVVEILTGGYLCSRRLLETQHAEWFDAASQQVLEKTDEETQKSVRFYFRPKTPTQFHNEGIKSKTSKSLAKFEAHCPMPVFLLFDIADTLSREGSQFSDGNLASSHKKLFCQPKNLWHLPWKEIYHNSSVNPITRRTIVHHRCAEIIIPENIDLNGLKFIYCRSEAEKETLFSLLQAHPKTLQRYQNCITSSGKYDLFFRQHTYIEQVNLLRDQVIVTTSPDTKSPGPFKVKVAISNSSNNKPYIKVREIEDLRPGIAVRVPKNFQDTYIFRLYLDDNLVYQNEFFDPSYDMDDIIF